MCRDFEKQENTYRPGLRLRSLRFITDDEIELDFEGIDAPDATFRASREWVTGLGWLHNFDEDFGRLYRGVPLLTAGMGVNAVIRGAWIARADELPTGESWQREFDAGKAELARRWNESRSDVGTVQGVEARLDELATPDLREHPVVVAGRLVAEQYPHAQAAYLAGSSVTGESTATSDLDIVVVLDGQPAPYRRTLRYAGWVVELFVQTSTSLRHYWNKDLANRKPALLRMCTQGHILASRDGLAETYAVEAAALLAAGPQAPAAEQMEMQRYLLTDLLDDIRGSLNSTELTYLASTVVLAASELLLVHVNAWTGAGKWLPRQLAEIDSGIAERLATGLREVTRDRKLLIDAVLEVLNRVGGPLTEGFHADGEDPDAARADLA